MLLPHHLPEQYALQLPRDTTVPEEPVVQPGGNCPAVIREFCKTPSWNGEAGLLYGADLCVRPLLSVWAPRGGRHPGLPLPCCGRGLFVTSKLRYRRMVTRKPYGTLAWVCMRTIAKMDERFSVGLEPAWRPGNGPESLAIAVSEKRASNEARFGIIRTH